MSDEIVKPGWGKGLWREMMIVLVLSMAAAWAGAKDEPVAGELHMIGSTPERPVAVVIERAADYVAVPVNIVPDPKSKKEEAALGIAEDLMKALSKTSTSRLKGRLVSRTRQPYIYLLMKVDEDEGDITAYEDVAAELFKKIFFSGNSRCELGKAALAMEDPENYRADITAAVFREVEKLAKLVGEDALIKLSGLEGPVQVRSNDDMTVQLFINYRLAVDTKASDIKMPAGPGEGRETRRPGR